MTGLFSKARPPARVDAPEGVASIGERSGPAAPSGLDAVTRLAELTAGFNEVELSLDLATATLWSTMTPPARPCFTRRLVAEYIALFAALRQLDEEAGPGAHPVKYVVYRSGVPGIFSLGGDLDLFARLIRAGDRERLSDYAHACAEMTYENAMGAGGLPIVTIALVEGQALGGGFESALSCNLIVAERSATFGLPEVLFNLFPGMGAYSYLARRVGEGVAERLILSGKTYRAEELHGLGVIDVLAENGEGEAAVRDYIRSNARRHNAQAAIYKTRRRVSPLTFEELRDVTDIWVDCALNLGETDLRKMEKLVAAQDRLRRAPPEKRSAAGAGQG